MPTADYPALTRATGLTSFPDRIHRVQARTRRITPPTTARTSVQFRCHFLFDTLWARLIRRPVIGVFPQN